MIAWPGEYFSPNATFHSPHTFSTIPNKAMAYVYLAVHDRNRIPKNWLTWCTAYAKHRRQYRYNGPD
jgi:hypothetical protein